MCTGEVNGQHYHFSDRSVMEAQVAQGLFLEHADVHGNMYGTSLGAVADVGRQGKMCVLDIDVQGAQQVRFCWAMWWHEMLQVCCRYNWMGWCNKMLRISWRCSWPAGEEHGMLECAGVWQDWQQACACQRCSDGAYTHMVPTSLATHRLLQEQTQPSQGQ